MDYFCKCQTSGCPPAEPRDLLSYEERAGTTNTIQLLRPQRLRSCTMGRTKVAQMVEVLNGLTARDALCLLVGCMLAVLDEAPSDEEHQLAG